MGVLDFLLMRLCRFVATPERAAIRSKSRRSRAFKKSHCLWMASSTDSEGSLVARITFISSIVYRCCPCRTSVLYRTLLLRACFRRVGGTICAIAAFSSAVLDAIRRATSASRVRTGWPLASKTPSLYGDGAFVAAPMGSVKAKGPPSSAPLRPFPTISPPCRVITIVRGFWGAEPSPPDSLRPLFGTSLTCFAGKEKEIFGAVAVGAPPTDPERGFTSAAVFWAAAPRGRCPTASTATAVRPVSNKGLRAALRPASAAIANAEGAAAVVCFCCDEAPPVLALALAGAEEPLGWPFD